MRGLQGFGDRGRRPNFYTQEPKLLCPATKCFIVAARSLARWGRWAPPECCGKLWERCWSTRWIARIGLLAALGGRRQSAVAPDRHGARMASAACQTAAPLDQMLEIVITWYKAVMREGYRS